MFVVLICSSSGGLQNRSVNHSKIVMGESDSFLGYSVDMKGYCQLFPSEI